MIQTSRISLFVFITIIININLIAKPILTKDGLPSISKEQSKQLDKKEEKVNPNLYLKAINKEVAGISQNLPKTFDNHTQFSDITLKKIYFLTLTTAISSENYKTLATAILNNNLDSRLMMINTLSKKLRIILKPWQLSILASNNVIIRNKIINKLAPKEAPALYIELPAKNYYPSYRNSYIAPQYLLSKLSNLFNSRSRHIEEEFAVVCNYFFPHNTKNHFDMSRIHNIFYLKLRPVLLQAIRSSQLYNAPNQIGGLDGGNLHWLYQYKDKNNELVSETIISFNPDLSIKS